MDYIYTPWKNRLIEDLQSATKEVFLVSPFIKSSIARDIYAVLEGKGITVRTVSRFAKAEFISGASDINAHFMLSGINTQSVNRYALRILSAVHAKIFIIDDRIAYLGSSNLTFSGLLRNFEGTIRLDDVAAIAPLRQRMAILWEKLRPVAKADFEDMLPQLSTVKSSQRREDADHFYNTKAAIEDDKNESSSDAALQQSVAQNFWTPVSEILTPSIGSLLSEAATIKEVTESNHGVPKATEEETPEAKAMLLAAKRLETHIVIIDRFFLLIANRFDIDTSKNPTRYASVLRTASARKMWSEEILPATRFGNIDPDTLYGDGDRDIDILGHNVFHLCAAEIAVKAGIVRAFGISIASMFVSKAGQTETLAALWDQNLLGPLLTGYSLDFEADNKVRQRLTATALRRLVASIYLEEGIQRTLDVIEEYLNPADVIGSDIVSLVELEDPKTTLQNITQQVYRVKPQYDEGYKSGGEHDGIWHIGVTIGTGLRAEGSGTNIREASTAAARAALDCMAKQTSGTRLLLEYRNALYRKAYKPSHPLFPQAGLDEQGALRVEVAFRQRYGLRIKPSLGFAACIDQETRRHLAVPYSNSTMAWFGSYLYQMFRNEIPEFRHTSLAVGFWEKLQNVLDIRGLRRDLGITIDTVQPQQVAQAVATALYFSNPYGSVRDFFVPLFRKLEEAQSKKSGSGKLKSRANLADFLQCYDTKIPYPSVLQELIQAKTTMLPTYTLRVLSPHTQVEDNIEVSAQWQGLSVKERASNKAIGRNKCAYQLLLLLITLDDFWKEPAPEIRTD